MLRTPEPTYRRVEGLIYLNYNQHRSEYKAAYVITFDNKKPLFQLFLPPRSFNAQRVVYGV